MVAAIVRPWNLQAYVTITKMNAVMVMPLEEWRKALALVFKVQAGPEGFDPTTCGSEDRRDILTTLRAPFS